MKSTLEVSGIHRLSDPVFLELAKACNSLNYLPLEINEAVSSGLIARNGIHQFEVFVEEPSLQAYAYYAPTEGGEELMEIDHTTTIREIEGWIEEVDALCVDQEIDESEVEEADDWLRESLS